MLCGLRLAHIRFWLKCTSRLELGQMPGSTLRGAFGSVFRRLVCVTRLPVCDGCLLRQQCAYGYVYETAPPADSRKLTSYQHIPRPFVFEPPTSRFYTADTTFSFDVVLIGRAIDYLPYVVYVFRELEKHGLGRGRQRGMGRFHLMHLTASTSSGEVVTLYERAEERLREGLPLVTGEDLLHRAAALPPDRITLDFRTPVRLKYEGRRQEDVQFHHLMRPLLRRLSAMLYFHCSGELEVDFRGLIRKAERVEKVEDGLRWREQSRYSVRQKQKMPMGGLAGRVTFAGDLAPFLPLLAAGEWLHVGKGCVMGMGKYQIIHNMPRDSEAVATVSMGQNA